MRKLSQRRCVPRGDPTPRTAPTHLHAIARHASAGPAQPWSRAARPSRRRLAVVCPRLSPCVVCPRLSPCVVCPRLLPCVVCPRLSPWCAHASRQLTPHHPRCLALTATPFPPHLPLRSCSRLWARRTPRSKRAWRGGPALTRWMPERAADSRGDCPSSRTCDWVHRRDCTDARLSHASSRDSEGMRAVARSMLSGECRFRLQSIHHTQGYRRHTVPYSTSAWL